MLNSLFGSNTHHGNMALQCWRCLLIVILHLVVRLVHEYIQRNAGEFLNPIRSKEMPVLDKVPIMMVLGFEPCILNDTASMKARNNIGPICYRSMKQHL